MNQNFIWTFFCLNFLFCVVHAQIKTDSLENEIPNASGTELIDIYNALGSEYAYFDLDKVWEVRIQYKHLDDSLFNLSKAQGQHLQSYLTIQK